jgi:DNA invertase Pin-like site-specific DNA recombinase
MKAKRAGIYVRVSSDSQDTGMQETELRESAERRGWEVTVYRDHAQSGAKEKRPGLDSMLVDVRRGKISVVMVWALDRLARSVKHLLELAEEFNALGVHLVALKQSIDTSSPAGMLTYVVLSAVAAFERDMLRERVRSGLRNAKLNGKRLGRPPLRQLTSEETAQLRSDRKRKQVPFRELANRFGCSVWTAHQLCGSSGESHVR